MVSECDIQNRVVLRLRAIIPNSVGMNPLDIIGQASQNQMENLAHAEIEVARMRDGEDAVRGLSAERIAEHLRQLYFNRDERLEHTMNSRVPTSNYTDEDVQRIMEEQVGSSHDTARPNPDRDLIDRHWNKYKDKKNDLVAKKDSVEELTAKVKNLELMIKNPIDLRNIIKQSKKIHKQIGKVGELQKETIRLQNENLKLQKELAMIRSESLLFEELRRSDYLKALKRGVISIIGSNGHKYDICLDGYIKKYYKNGKLKVTDDLFGTNNGKQEKKSYTAKIQDCGGYVMGDVLSTLIFLIRNEADKFDEMKQCGEIKYGKSFSVGDYARIPIVVSDDVPENIAWIMSGDEIATITADSQDITLPDIDEEIINKLESHGYSLASSNDERTGDDILRRQVWSRGPPHDPDIITTLTSWLTSKGCLDVLARRRPYDAVEISFDLQRSYIPPPVDENGEEITYQSFLQTNGFNMYRHGNDGEVIIEEWHNTELVNPDLHFLDRCGLQDIRQRKRRFPSMDEYPSGTMISFTRPPTLPSGENDDPMRTIRMEYARQLNRLGDELTEVVTELSRLNPVVQMGEMNDLPETVELSDARRIQYLEEKKRHIEAEIQRIHTLVFHID